MPPKKKETGSLEELLGLLSAGLSNPKPNNFQYQPHYKQLAFHQSNKNGRLYLGGNRSGKTTGGINEDIWWLTGTHPFIKLPKPPIYGRVVTVDFKNGANKIILPQLKQWLPPSYLINGSWEDSYNSHKHILTLSNDSELEIMSYDQELDKFAGVPRHFTHFDEEPPNDIFKECKARLVDYNGRWWITMTPVEGMTWTFDEVFEKRNTEFIDVIEVNIHDNPHLSEEAIRALLQDFSEDEREIREAGKFIAISGLVFKGYDPEKHVLPEGIPPKDWTHYVSMDAGFNNPTAILWHAVDPKTGTVITYKEHYKREWTVDQHANYLKEELATLAREYGITPFLFIADPAIKQRSQATGLSIQVMYSQEGIYWALGKEKNIDAGLDKMNRYLRHGKWFITESCPNLQKEMRKYRRAQYSTSKLREKNNVKEEPQKKDDHAIDSVRYFFSFMPDLAPVAQDAAKVEKPNLLNAPTVTRRQNYGRVDENLHREPSNNRVHIVHDEFVGEW